jgi:hypothetical protein
LADDREIKTLYGAFALSVWQDLVKVCPEMPSVVVTIGDNWYLITLCAAPARSSLESLVTESGIFITESTDILERNTEAYAHSGIQTLSDILKIAQATCAERNLPTDALTVLDRSSVAYRDQIFDFEKAKVGDSHSESWGGVIELGNPPIEMFLITHGYAAKDEEYLRDLVFGKDLPDTHLWD